LAIPSPEPGLVLNYAYLWHDEFRSGRDEGRKNRPTEIVLFATQADDQATIITVLPITHATQVQYMHFHRNLLDLIPTATIKVDVALHIEIDQPPTKVFRSQTSYVFPHPSSSNQANCREQHYAANPQLQCLFWSEIAEMGLSPNS
jgi:hypothetical protein